MLFYLIDIDYEESIILYGIDENGKRVRLIDPSYRPSFLVLPYNIDSALNDIERIRKERGLTITELKLDRLIFNGEEREFIRVFTERAQDLQKIRDEIKLLEKGRGGSGSVIDEFEYQISATRIYLAERGISCLDWYEVEEKKGRILSINRAEGLRPSLKVLSFDMEVLEIERGTPSVVMISLYGEGIAKVITYQEASYSIDAVIVRNEKELIETFIKFIREFDPDIIVGYNSDLYDMPIL